MYKKITHSEGVYHRHALLLLRMMKLIAIILSIGMLQVSLAAKGQKVSLSETNATLDKVFLKISEQTGFGFLVEGRMLKGTKPVTINVHDAELAEVLRLVFENQPLTYALEDQAVVVSRKRATPRIPGMPKHEAEGLILAYPIVSGRIVDTAGVALVGASVRVLDAEGKRTGLQTKTDHDGYFTLRNVPEDAQLEISYIGYLQRLVIAAAELGNIMLKAAESALEEVEVMVNTGYQQLPKERATGSFVHIDNQMLNKTTGKDILARLEGIVPGLLFDRTVASGEANETYELSSRGRATIMSDSKPLIILDNFPYEGRIEDINPNDVESITVLRDAASASIWGAKAGNGVIVITSKVGRFDQKPTLSISHNTRLTNKPDLFYDPNFLDATTVMGIEEERFAKGWYDTQDDKALMSTPYAELLIQRDKGRISEAEFQQLRSQMLTTDVRHDMSKYFYQQGVEQQTSMNISGGSQTNRYYMALGYDRNNATITRNESESYSLNFQNAYRPLKNLEVDIRLGYNENYAKNNGINITEVGRLRMGLVPYTRLVNEDGSPATVANTYREYILETQTVPNALPWHYKPLEELNLRDQNSFNNRLMVASNIRYSIFGFLNLSGQYTLSKSTSKASEYFSKETYYVRDLVNAYTQADGTRIIPYEGILREAIPSEGIQHSGRLMINGQKQFDNHEVAALVGGEIQQFTTEYFSGTLLYNYNKDLGYGGDARMDYSRSYPKFNSGNQYIPRADFANIGHFLDRYLSYFGNFSYTYNKRYILSGSARWDGSNLFGVKANQKGTLLYSVGGSWDITKEPFFNASLFNVLKLRVTYGRSGNINKTVTAQPVLQIRTSSNIGGSALAFQTSLGNPNLKWETVNMFNAGLDFSILENRISGTVEAFVKDARDLIGDRILAPSTGLNSRMYHSHSNARNYRYNYAGLQTQGLDINLQSVNTKGQVRWQTNLIISYATDQVVSYYNSPQATTSDFMSHNAYKEGVSVNMLYAYPWYGLSPENGSVLVYDKEGNLSTGYNAVIQTYQYDDLDKAGLTVAPSYGSVLNSLAWQGLEISILVSGKAGYVYRRSSIFPGEEYGQSSSSSLNFHVDLYKKWQKPGDEMHTVVPKGGDINGYNSQEMNYYKNSGALVAKGDHLLLQYINLNYSPPRSISSRLYLNHVNFFLIANNLGVLWKADKSAINPNTPNARYPLARTYSFGATLKF